MGAERICRGFICQHPPLHGPGVYEAANAAASLKAAAIKLAGGSEVIPAALKWAKLVV